MRSFLASGWQPPRSSDCTRRLILAYKFRRSLSFICFFWELQSHNRSRREGISSKSNVERYTSYRNLSLVSYPTAKQDESTRQILGSDAPMRPHPLIAFARPY